MLPTTSRGAAVALPRLAWSREIAGAVTPAAAAATGQPTGQLIAGAEHVPAGAGGLLMLPYFAGERRPRLDPGARGVALGLTLKHTPEHLMRAALEAVALGVRHNLEAFDSVRPKGTSWRRVAVGGGAAGALWPQIVTDVTGREQAIPALTIGACYGDALLAATAAGLVPPGTNWTTIASVVRPRPEYAELRRALPRVPGPLSGDPPAA